MLDFQSLLRSASWKGPSVYQPQWAIAGSAIVINPMPQSSMHHGNISESTGFIAAQALDAGARLLVPSTIQPFNEGQWSEDYLGPSTSMGLAPYGGYSNPAQDATAMDLAATPQAVLPPPPMTGYPGATYPAMDIPMSSYYAPEYAVASPMNNALPGNARLEDSKTPPGSQSSPTDPSFYRPQGW